MKLLRPIFATKKAWEGFWPLLLTSRSTASRISPDLLGVPSTFCTFRGLTSVLVTSLRRSTACGWIKHSVAPQSSSAFWLTCFVLVCSWKGTWIAWFQAIYIEPELFRTAWVRAVVLRCQENPYLLPRSAFHPWMPHDLPWLDEPLTQQGT